MDEVEALVRSLLGAAASGRAGERLSYREAFSRELGLDPLSAPFAQLQERRAQPLGFAAARAAARDTWTRAAHGKPYRAAARRATP